MLSENVFELVDLLITVLADVIVDDSQYTGGDNVFIVRSIEN